MQPVTPTLLHQTELDRHATDLRSSPSGRRLAVRVVRRSQGEGPWVFRVLGTADDRWELAAGDLAFLDDDRLVVLRREDKRLQLALVSGSSSATPVWRVTLPDLTDAHVTVSPATGAWTVIGGDPESESTVVAVAGVVGQQETRARRWILASESDERSAWAVTGLETAFEVRMRLRGDWYWRWPLLPTLLPTLLGHVPFESEIWRRGPDGDRRLASAVSVIRCTAAAEETVVCLGYGTAERAVWVFRDGLPASETPAILPASTWKVGFFENRLLGMTAGNAVLILDADGQRGIQLNLSPEQGRAVDALLVGGRLAVLSSGPSGAAVRIYALP